MCILHFNHTLHVKVISIKIVIIIIIAQVHAIVITPRDTLSATGKNEQPYKIHSLYI